jgi:hypothetical protein
MRVRTAACQGPHSCLPESNGISLVEGREDLECEWEKEERVEIGVVAKGTGAKGTGAKGTGGDCIRGEKRVVGGTCKG